MNVLHANSNYLTSKLHENLIDQLELRGINNTIFMPIKPETTNEFLYNSKNEVYTPVTFREIDKYFFSIKQHKIYKRLIETLNVRDYNIMHAHTLFTDGNIAYQLKKDYHIPYIVTVRGHTDIERFFRLRINLRRRGRAILSEADKIAFLTSVHRDKLIKKYIYDEKLAKNIIEKSIIQPNGIDDFWFENEGIPKTIKGENQLNIIFVGKFMERKNPLNTVKALNGLKETKNMKINFRSVGEIVEQSYAQKVKDAAKISFQIIPPQPVEKLIQHYRENDIFVMPSFSETFGLVYPEAMSQGLPVIYTKNQGFDGQFEEEAVGYAVDADNPRNIAEKILMVLENYDMLSMNALNGYKKFNWENLSKQHINVYKEIISN